MCCRTNSCEPVLRCVLYGQHCPCPFNCNATRQDKGRKRGNLKEAVESFIEWLNSRAAVHSAERIKIEYYRNSSRLSSWAQLRGRSIVSLHFDQASRNEVNECSTAIPAFCGPPAQGLHKTTTEFSTLVSHALAVADAPEKYPIMELTRAAIVLENEQKSHALSKHCPG